MSQTSFQCQVEEIQTLVRIRGASGLIFLCTGEPPVLRNQASLVVLACFYRWPSWDKERSIHTESHRLHPESPRLHTESHRITQCDSIC